MRYQLLSVFFAVAAVPLGCFAILPAPRWDNMRVKHAWEAVPENWESLGIPREKALVTALYEVSSPGHSKHEQVAELVIPHPHTLELVKSWLKYHGVPSPTSMTHGGNWLTLTGVSVSKANDLLGASYQLYRHVETKEVIIRTVGYSLPAALHGHVQTVAPTTYFASPRMSWQTPRMRFGGAAAGQVKATSGDLVTALLGRDDYGTTPPFLHWLYNSATGATYTVVQVNSGGYDPNNPGIEASVDVQYTSGMAIGNGPEGEDDPYLSWLDHMLNLDQTDIPQTISSSYANYEREFPLDHARTVCDLFMQLGARGVSVLIASGDYGVGKGDCMTDGNVRFRPTFPASCPWVTGVGGTLGYPETAADFSGGGFSEYFKRPDYQDDAVTPFFEILGNQYHGLYNASGRGFPDIAAQSYDIAIMLGGEYYEALDGTSCSTPLTVNGQIVAGIISLLNDYRISQGKHPLGFLNPWLYGTARRAGLNDITSGSNPGCNTDGFSAIEGWDPVTGLGSPDFERLQQIANFLP
ncbi:subtilisin-like protein [Lactarius deliciosus]|nr:subtilisin-like protein [Lactarius deliciosus]